MTSSIPENYLLKTFPPLYRLGERFYVNGLSIIEELVRSYDKEISRTDIITNIKLFKFNGFVTKNSTVYYIPSGDKFNPKKTPDAMMSFDTELGSNHKFLIYQNVNEPDAIQVPDMDRSKYIENESLTDDHNDSIELKNIYDPNDFFRALIESNNRFSKRIAKNDGVESGTAWAHLRNFKYPSLLECRDIKQINYKFISKRQIGDTVFLLRKFNLSGSKEIFDSEICFFYKLPSS
jgi:hypothetical protein